MASETDTLIKVIDPGRCGYCNRIVRGVKRRHMNTAYTEEDRNYMTSCRACFNASELEWDAMWKEYNAGRL